MKAKFDTAAKKMLNKRGAIRGAWPTASVTGNHARTYHHGIDSWLKSLLIFSTTKQANTNGRSIRLTELYALMRPIKHAYSGVRFFPHLFRFDREPLRTLVVVIKAANDNLQEYLAGVGHQ